VDIDPVVRDPYGIPAVRVHFRWGQNELKMFEHSKKVCAELLRAAGAALEYSAKEP